MSRRAAGGAACRAACILGLALLAPFASRAGAAAPPGGETLADSLARPARVSSRVDKAHVSLGEPFTLRIEVIHAAADAVALPEPLQLAPLTLRAPPETVREGVPEGARTVFTLRVANVASLEPRVPDIALAVQGPTGPRTLNVPGQKLELKSLVAEEGAPDSAHAHRGPKPPLPVLVRSFLWAGLLAGLLLLAAAAAALARLWRKRKTRVVEPRQPSFEEVALARLSALRSREPWKRGDGRSAVFELSETLRGYLGRRLGFEALDLTSDELLRELRGRSLPGLDLAALGDELAWEDLVKFAKADAQASECLSAIDLAEAVVRRTAKAPPPAPGGPPAAAEAAP